MQISSQILEIHKSQLSNHIGHQCGIVVLINRLELICKRWV